MQRRLSEKTAAVLLMRKSECEYDIIKYSTFHYDDNNDRELR